MGFWRTHVIFFIHKNENIYKYKYKSVNRKDLWNKYRSTECLWFYIRVEIDAIFKPIKNAC